MPSDLPDPLQAALEAVKAAHEELARTKEQTAADLKGRDDVLAVVVHELKNPLNTILMASTAQLMKLEQGTLSFSYAERIRRGALRMTRLIDDLVDMSRIQASRLVLQRERHDFAELVRHAWEDHQVAAAAKQITIDVTAPPELMVEADPTRLAQVLGNLLGNAIKFTPAAGTIVMHLTSDDTDAILSIADTGPGIDSARLEHVFDRHWQAKDTAAFGSGLGLYIVKGILDAHGGSAWVESEPGSGATFWVRLPRDARPSNLAPLPR